MAMLRFFISIKTKISMSNSKHLFFNNGLDAESIPIGIGTVQTAGLVRLTKKIEINFLESH